MSFLKKTLLRSLSSCPSWPMVRTGPFLSCMGKWISSCSTDLITNSGALISLAMKLMVFLESFSIMARISQQIRMFFFQKELTENFWLLDFHYHNWTHPTLFESSAISADWHANTLKSPYWRFSRECLQYSTLFPSFRMTELRHATFITDSD